MKKGALILLSSILFISLIAFVSAALSDINTVSDITNPFVNFFAPWFSGNESFTKLLFAALFYMIIYSVADAMFKGKKGTTIGISLIITILSVFFLPASFITTVRDQYGIMGAAILSVIPFMIMLIFTVRVGSLLAGRVLWAFYVVYYFALYIYRIASIGVVNWLSPEVIPYLGAIIAGILIFFFIVPLREMLFEGEMSEIQEAGTQTVQRAKLLHKLQKKELEQYNDL